ncbi:hypothetical protein FT663_01003 [Candidozyma haemuli var. vulneris]|nr:hypothetical protein FT662_01574 [[Candida] haemuloni var. vulneris]KAF3994898.1 hypothetical protein FT663_01003 [[Candida] haemuloni var. vulneris]
MTLRATPLLRRCSRHIHCTIPPREASKGKELPRVNPLGIQYLSNEIHKKVFPKNPPNAYKKSENPELLELTKKHLDHNHLLGKKTNITDPITIPNLPDLVGKNSLDEHFTRIGFEAASPYLQMAETFFKDDMNLPKQPKEWEFKAGWTRYAPGKKPESVDYPLEKELVFDVEVMYKKSPYAVLCTAVSPKAWYAWVSPVLTSKTTNWNHLIPFNTQDEEKLLVGYNVSYDRARILEEYNIKESKAFFLDGMALHIALSGICSQQRPAWVKHKKHKVALEELETSEGADAEVADFETPESETSISMDDIAKELTEDPWLDKGATNSLANVAEFHCGIKLKKDIRDTFSTEDKSLIVDQFQSLMDYCASDVIATYEVTKKLFPQFRERNPHPVSFAALKQLGKLFLPTTRKWDQYLESAEGVYEKNRDEVSTILQERANELVRYITEEDESLKPDIENDPWLRQLNWTLKEPRYRKDGSPVANQAYLTGYPEWYRELFKSSQSDNGEKERVMNITVRSRVTPLLLRLKWEGYPLLWTDTSGWCFKVPYDEEIIDSMLAKNYTKARLSPKEFEEMLPELRDNGVYELFKVPHPEGARKRCTIIMSKSYLRYFESGVLTSEYDYATKILSLNATASYWIGNRARISEQFVVYADPKGKENNFFKNKKDCKAHSDMGIIIPKLCTMGTITRRATENTWLTASNSKANRIGSELKAMIEAPDGYAFVGADVDSEELWIASLIGDSMFRIHGGTSLGWMCLEGDKSEKTDLHSRTADIMGISRNDAKVFNYGRIYGAGVKFATRLLKQCNVNLSDKEAEKLATALYEQTKGQTSYSKIFERRMYHGGTESVMFNALEAIAYQERPKTPVLGASITDALTQKYLNKNNYLTSRINWTIQSSGVDYLHLLVISMEYLLKRYKVDARLMITVHDEVRYMAKEEDKLKCALLLQISNLWTRAMFCEQLRILELPQSCAFFSEVDIDHVLRKEVSLDCVTPSHPEAIPPGKSYDMNALLEEVNAEEALKAKSSALKYDKLLNYSPRPPVISSLQATGSKDLQAAKLRLQNSVDKDDWKCHVLIHNKIERDEERRLAKPSYQKPATRTSRKRKIEEEPDLGKDGNATLMEEISSSPATTTTKRSTKPATARTSTRPTRKTYTKTSSNQRNSKSFKHAEPESALPVFNTAKTGRARFAAASQYVTSSSFSTFNGAWGGTTSTKKSQAKKAGVNYVKPVKTAPLVHKAKVATSHRSLHTKISWPTVDDHNFERPRKLRHEIELKFRPKKEKEIFRRH